MIVYVPGFGVYRALPLNRVRVMGQAAPQFLGQMIEQPQIPCFPCASCGRHRPTDEFSCPHCGRSAGWAKCGGRDCRIEDLRPANVPADATGWDRETGWWTRAEIVPHAGDRGMGSVRNEIIEIHTDASDTLRGLFLDRIPAHCGTYVRNGSSWEFALDPATRVKLLLRGVRTPVSLPADELVGWKTVPTHPLVGGFTHPRYGFHCRAAAIPVEWDVLIHGRPGITFRGGDGNLLSSLSDDPGRPGMTSIQRAQLVAQKINKTIGSLGPNPAPWWLYTLPAVRDDGAPIVTVGVKGDYQPDAKELAALPWADWRLHGAVIRVEYVPPKGSAVRSTFVDVLPLGSGAAVGASGMGSAPIDTVWPTDSPDYHEPTGPATGDDDFAMGNGMGITPEESFAGYRTYMEEMRRKGLLMSQQPGRRCPPGTLPAVATFGMPRPGGGSQSICAETCDPEPRCPQCGAIASSASKFMPEYFCDNGHRWAPVTGMGQSSHGFPLRWRDPARYNHPRPVEQWAPLPVRAPQWPWPPGPPGDASDEGGGECPADDGLGYAPVVAMPTGMLNWDRVTGYEGQPWVTKDWSGQGFMGDTTPSGAAPRPESGKSDVAGLVGAVAGGAAAFVASSRWFAPQGRVSAETPVIAGTSAAGALGGYVVARAIARWFES